MLVVFTHQQLRYVIQMPEISCVRVVFITALCLSATFWSGSASLLFLQRKAPRRGILLLRRDHNFLKIYINPNVNLQHGMSFQLQREPPFDVGSLWFQWCYESICCRGTFISAVVSNAVTYVNHIICNDKQLAGSHNVRKVLLCAEWVHGRLPRRGVFSSWGPCDSCFDCKSHPLSSQYLLWLSQKNIRLELWLRVAMFMSSGYDWVLDGSIYCWNQRGISCLEQSFNFGHPL